MSSEDPFPRRPRSPAGEHADTYRQLVVAPADDLSKLTPNEIRARINAIDDERERLRMERIKLSEALDVILSRRLGTGPGHDPEPE